MAKVAQRALAAFPPHPTSPPRGRGAFKLRRGIARAATAGRSGCLPLTCRQRPAGAVAKRRDAAGRQVKGPRPRAEYAIITA